MPCFVAHFKCGLCIAQVQVCGSEDTQAIENSFMPVSVAIGFTP